MTEDYDQPRPEPVGSELHTANLRRSDDIPRNTDDKEVSKALVKHNLRRHARIGTSEDDGKRLLAGDQLRAASETGQADAASYA